jgi:hypothetical protein
MRVPLDAEPGVSQDGIQDGDIFGEAYGAHIATVSTMGQGKIPRRVESAGSCWPFRCRVRLARVANQLLGLLIGERLDLRQQLRHR